MATLLVELGTFVAPGVATITVQRCRKVIYWDVEGVSVKASELDCVFAFANAEMSRETLSIEFIGQLSCLFERRTGALGFVGGLGVYL